MQTVVLYQLPDGHKRIFEPYNKKYFNMRDYEIVYECERLNNYKPDDAFNEFNNNKPENFGGRSLSTSDVIGIGNNMYYCNPFNWIKLKPSDYE